MQKQTLQLAMSSGTPHFSLRIRSTRNRGPPGGRGARECTGLKKTKAHDEGGKRRWAFPRHFGGRTALSRQRQCRVPLPGWFSCRSSNQRRGSLRGVRLAPDGNEAVAAAGGTPQKQFLTWLSRSLASPDRSSLFTTPPK